MENERGIWCPFEVVYTEKDGTEVQKFFSSPATMEKFLRENKQARKNLRRKGLMS